MIRLRAPGLSTDTIDPDVNPFPVYPVQPLSDIDDIIAATVATAEVETVRDAVNHYANSFKSGADVKNESLILALKGDFGTGKTHLMRYARQVLEMNARDPGSPEAQATILPPKIMLLAASESSIEEWYLETVGPALLSLVPREIVRELMIEVACEVALESPLTEHLVELFRTLPQTLYQALREADEIDASSVNRRFSERLVRLLPRANQNVRRAIEALRWGETAELAERWLAGDELDDIERERIGINAVVPLGVRASSAIAMVAAMCRELRRPFLVFIDEFEHLARHDHRNRSRSNVTWVKRLIETLARQHSMVMVSGHWEAWKQQGDFLDRFTGRPALQLVRLTPNDVMKIVQVRAPEWKTFSMAAAEAVVDVTGGNIRRAMTVLYDLYADRSTRLRELSSSDVISAGLRRLQRGELDSIWPAIEGSVRAKNGTVERDARILDRGVDAVIRFGNEIRLLVAVTHAHEEGLLLEAGENFADLVQRMRQLEPQVRGLFVALGAVNPDHLRRLDAARTETEVLNGEASEVTLRVTESIAKALAPKTDVEAHPVSDQREIDDLREDLNRLRAQLLARSEEQTMRSKEVFGADERSTIVRSTIVESPEQIARQREDIESRGAFDRMVAEERNARVTIYLGRLALPSVLALLCIFGLVTASDLVSLMTGPLSEYRRYQFDAVVMLSKGVFLVAFLACVYLAFQRYIGVSRHLANRMSVLFELRDMPLPTRAIERVRRTMDDISVKHGYRPSAIVEIDELIKRTFGQA